jgi:hypothetical protein
LFSVANTKEVNRVVAGEVDLVDGKLQPRHGGVLPIKHTVVITSFAGELKEEESHLRFPLMASCSDAP